MRIQMASYLEESSTNGPGLRSVLWVQGCPKRCAGCWNPSFLSNSGGRWVSLDEAEALLSRSPRIEGLTLLGGEPFAQARPLAQLARRFQERGLSVMAYSGFTQAELGTQGTDVQELLSHCDILVDGEYDQNQAGPYLWRGSKNQKIHFLTPRYRSWVDQTDQEYRDFELLWDEGRLVLTGDPPPEMMAIVRDLSRRAPVHG